MKAVRNITLSLAALALVAAPAAFAGTLTVFGVPTSSTQVPVSVTPVMENISVAQFNIAGQQLDSVEVIMSGNGSTDYIVSYTGDGTAVVTSFDTVAHLYLNGLTIPTLNLALSGIDDMSATPVNLTNGQNFDTGYQPIIGSNVSEFIVSPFAAWMGAGTVDFSLTGGAQSGYLGTIPSGGALTLAPTTIGGATVEVIYNYSDINKTPEPGTLTLFGTGLLGLAGMLRQKFMHSR